MNALAETPEVTPERWLFTAPWDPVVVRRASPCDPDDVPWQAHADSLGAYATGYRED